MLYTCVTAKPVVFLLALPDRYMFISLIARKIPDKTNKTVSCHQKSYSDPNRDNAAFPSVVCGYSSLHKNASLPRRCKSQLWPLRAALCRLPDTGAVDKAADEFGRIADARLESD